jgi:hypothetical protein
MRNQSTKQGLLTLPRRGQCSPYSECSRIFVDDSDKATRDLLYLSTSFHHANEPHKKPPLQFLLQKEAERRGFSECLEAQRRGSSDKPAPIPVMESDLQQVKWTPSLRCILEKFLFS